MPETSVHLARIGLGDDRFDLNFTFNPEIPVPQQDAQVALVTSASLIEEVQLVNMAELLNFNLVTAESMVGLIMGLGTALQEMANSGLFAGYDIPFADAAWSDLLNFFDSDKAALSGNTLGRR